MTIMRQTANTHPHVNPSPVPHQGLSALVVEHDPDQQWRLARMLTVSGHRVVGTSSGDGALALLAEWPVDVALVSETLPGMSGVEVTKRIGDRAPHIPVVLMAAPTSDVHFAAGVAGAAAFLTKPFSVDVLRQVLDSLHLGARE